MFVTEHIRPGVIPWHPLLIRIDFATNRFCRFVEALKPVVRASQSVFSLHAHRCLAPFALSFPTFPPWSCFVASGDKWWGLGERKLLCPQVLGLKPSWSQQLPCTSPEASFLSPLQRATFRNLVDVVRLRVVFRDEPFRELCTRRYLLASRRERLALLIH